MPDPAQGEGILTDDDSRRHAAVQLAVYRLAWAALAGIPDTEVRAAFHYVRSGRTVVPESLYGPDELAALVTAGRALPVTARREGERCA